MTVSRERVESTLVALLQTPSYAGEEAAVADWVQARLESLGFSVTRDDCHQRLGGDTGNLLARLPGTVDAPALFFNSHLDTVERTDGLTLVFDGDVLRTDGTTILGGDDKAGVAAILCGVEAALADGGPHPPLELVFTVQEEVGLCGAKAFDTSQLTAAFGFVYDHGVPLGEVCVAAPSQTSHTLTFTGRAAHAGVEPEKGVNAIACAAHAISRVRQGRLDFETTCNLGQIRGGSATNIVPAQCAIEAEVRSRHPGKLEAQVEHLRVTCEESAAQFGCEFEFTRREAYQAFRIEPDEPVARLAAAALSAAGLPVTWADGGGGSDANVWNAAGLRCVILSCGERAVHTHAEHLHISDVVAAAEGVAHLVALGAASGSA